MCKCSAEPLECTLRDGQGCVRLQVSTLDRGMALLYPRSPANHAAFAEVQGLIAVLKAQLLGRPTPAGILASSASQP